MTDLHTRFKTLDSVSAPDLWYDIEERAMAMQPTRPRSSAWVLIAVTLLLALAIGGAVLVGSGILKLPAVVENSASPSATAKGSPASVAPSSTPVQAAGAWTATGDMVEPRSDATFTLLVDGRVLVTGGYGPIPDAVLASAELYDPSTGSWTATGSMVGGHGVHTATRLLDGRVLVAGGGSGSGPLTTAELFDPSSGSWTTTGSMIEGHGGHVAALLVDGRVLVAGGCCDGSGSDVTSAELYDPNSGTWTATGDMVEVRSRATITLLRDGRVLVTGGQSFGVGTAELYDPSTGTWTATASMAAGRIGHTAVLLPDGRVLVAGGYTFDRTGNNATTLASAELYDPTSGTWTATGSMIEGRNGHTAVLLADGTVLAAGGFPIEDGSNPWPFLASAELFDPISGSWSAAAGMIEARSGHMAALLLNGQVLVASGGSTLGSTELYDPGSGS